MSNDDVIDTLNDLIETSRDGEYGFRLSAEHVKAPELKSTLASRADDCRRAAEELRAQVAQLGGKADDGGSATGAMHRGWVSVREKLSTSTDQAMLAECERGEDAAVARYRKALQKPLPEPVRAIVQRQCDGAVRNHDEIRSLRDRYAKAA